ncbi:MAG: hypothetical protein JNK43_08230 [Ignavibacteria bacterium]|nr:hypothetical protein [Ignavibacteria bacterium]
MNTFHSAYKMLKYKKIFFLSLLLATLLLLLPSCQQDQTVIPSASGESNMSVGFFTEVESGDNTLTLSEAKFNVKSMKLDNHGHHGECDVRIGPFVVYLDLLPKYVNATITTIPIGRYESIKFHIHKPNPNEPMPDPDFIESNNRRYSVVVKGTYNGQGFVYKSSINVARKVFLDNYPIEVAERPLINITITVNPYSWFRENGVFLNPMDEGNSHKIDHNIKESLKRAFRDLNCDGWPD